MNQLFLISMLPSLVRHASSLIPYAHMLYALGLGLNALGSGMGHRQDAGNTSPPSHAPRIRPGGPRGPLGTRLTCLNIRQLVFASLYMTKQLCYTMLRRLTPPNGHVKAGYDWSNMATIPPTQTCPGSGVVCADF